MLQALVRNHRTCSFYGNGRRRSDRPGQAHQTMPLVSKAYFGLLTRRAVDALLRHLCQPAADMGIGRIDIEEQAGRLQRCRQRRDKAGLQIAVESFDLALGSGSIGSTQPGTKAKLIGQRGKRWVPAMLTLAVCISFGDDRTGVVKKNLFRNTAK